MTNYETLQFVLSFAIFKVPCLCGPTQANAGIEYQSNLKASPHEIIELAKLGNCPI
jgi:hypothetical protein